MLKLTKMYASVYTTIFVDFIIFCIVIDIVIKYRNFPNIIRIF